ncbi:hypothetical protein N7530_001241 [Penicillium desertorum]|uniref:Uncharacterized protein n=1 Tax=Penicillium desertorum TaxID=1303715 RepID=A0A9W9XAD0_9EURO|nr:hypothetical protein N7530_001241 [Penicillium desertorum]
MSGHWDVEQCNNKQLEFQLAGHESNVKSGRLVSTTTGWDGGGDDVANIEGSRVGSPLCQLRGGSVSVFAFKITGLELPL